jgi:Rps23 Pro-64 3,4-dihydroxylase Tpa1-like proline 4-hydroxylase
VHHDYAVKYFFKGDSLPNSVVPIVTRTKEENNQMGASFGARRVIAIIMYLFGDDWQEGDGGGTGIYLSKNSEPCEVVDPKQNRLFGFHISPKSFHAFQGNKKPRVTIVQWFHVNPTW